MTFERAVLLGGMPAAFMLVSTYIGLERAVPDGVAGALQHFAAGVLLCTVGTELLPEIVDASGYAENVSAFIGFFMGVAVLILLGMLSPVNSSFQEGNTTSKRSEQQVEDDGSENNEDFFFFYGCRSPGQVQQLREGKFFIAGRKYRQLRPRRDPTGKPAMKRRSMSLSSLPLVSENSGSSDDRSYGSTDKHRNNGESEKEAKEITSEKLGKIKENGNEGAPIKMFPLAFVLAVAVDSSLDGLLIGIASAAGPSAGPMMSVSLSVEMSFLGLTLATTLNGQNMPKSVLSAIVGPACLVLAAGLGGTMAESLSHSPILFVGMLSFGASALLFMVSEELLLDAHEDGKHLWWVDLQLYTGFFASIVAGKLVR